MTWTLMKPLLTLILLCSSFSSFSQWDYRIIDNDFDEPFKTAVSAKNGDCVLRLFEAVVIDAVTLRDSVIIKNDTIIKMFFSPEYPDGIPDTIIKTASVERMILESSNIYSISFHIVGSYFCSENIPIEIVLICAGQHRKYTFNGKTYNNNQGLVITDLKFQKRENVEFDKTDIQFVSDFKNASLIKLRINDNYCETEYYEFSMIGSSAAIDFLTEIQE